MADETPRSPEPVHEQWCRDPYQHRCGEPPESVAPPDAPPALLRALDELAAIPSFGDIPFSLIRRLHDLARSESAIASRPEGRGEAPPAVTPSEPHANEPGWFDEWSAVTPSEEKLRAAVVGKLDVCEWCMAAIRTDQPHSHAAKP